MKNLKVIEQLKVKATDKGRMPSLKKVSDLLNELNIKHSLMEWSEEKWSKPSGFRYFTSGGGKTYFGYRLYIPEIRLEMVSTDSYYSWNNYRYARQILELITSKKQN